MRRSVLVGMVVVGLGCAAKRLPSPEQAPSPTSVPSPATNLPAPSEPERKPTDELQPLTVHFELDSSALVDEAQRNLATYAFEVRKRGPASLELEGHTCEVGTEEYNLVLGHQRADAARRYLRDLGVDERLMNSVSYGELKPVELGSSPQALSQNRRAVVRVGRR